MILNKPSEEELRNLIKEGKTLYQISRHFNMMIKEVFKLGRSYGISFDYYHNHIPKPSKQDLESMYNDEGMTQRQITKEFGVSRGTVFNLMSHYNIPTRGSRGTIETVPPKEVLQRMYSDERMTQYQISQEFNVGESTVHFWLRRYNISTAGRGGAKVQNVSKEVIERMYNDEGMNQEQIAKEFDVYQHTVIGWFRKYNIPTRGGNGTLAVSRPAKDELLNYIAEGLNQHQIAEHFKVCDATIFKWCEYYGIPGMVNGFRFTTDEHINWRYAVFERDHYTCQMCGATNTYIEPHHIVPFCDHPEVAYDVENGITLCKGCHKSIRGIEYDYIEQFAAISQPHLRDHEVIESMPCEAPLELHSIIDYPQEVIA